MIPPLVFDLLGLVALFYTLTTRAVQVRQFLLALAASALAFWSHLRVHELWAGRVLHLSPQEARALPIFEPLLAAQTVAAVLADRRRFADGAWVLHLGELAAVIEAASQMKPSLHQNFLMKRLFSWLQQRSPRQIVPLIGIPSQNQLSRLFLNGNKRE